MMTIRRGVLGHSLEEKGLEQGLQGLWAGKNGQEHAKERYTGCLPIYD